MLKYFSASCRKSSVAQLRKNTKVRLRGNVVSSRTLLQGIKELKSYSNNKALWEITREQNKQTGELEWIFPLLVYFSVTEKKKKWSHLSGP